MNNEELVNLNMKEVILNKWKSKLGYLFNHKDLEELENIINYYEQENNQLKERINMTININRKNKELHNKIDKAIDLYKNCKAEDYCTLDLDMYNALIGGDVDDNG